jgi:tRNA(Arg) A34 adenosine deaminase TadA
VSLEPCLMCLGAALASRVRRVVFAARSPKFGALSAGGGAWLRAVPHAMIVECAEDALVDRAGAGVETRAAAAAADDDDDVGTAAASADAAECARESAALLRVFFEARRAARREKILSTRDAQNSATLV